MDETEARAWHEALVVALTGERRPDLGRQDTPDLDVVVAVVGPGSHGAHPVPADLMDGLGPARFAAVLTELRARLATSQSRPVLAQRAPDADERRLLAEVPPHH